MSLEALWSHAIREAAASLGWPALPDGELLEPPGDLAHGDCTSNIAMRMARELEQPPRTLAEALAGALDIDATVAGPGFLNLRADRDYFESLVRRILDEGSQFGRSVVGDNQRVLIEFVSANPTGPLTVAHARQAVVGDVLCNCFEFTGHDVCREYYVNDGGRQIRLLGESVYARYRNEPLPEEGYKGAYIADLAAQIRDAQGDRFDAMERDTAVAELGRWAGATLMAGIERDLADFHVRYDVYTRESQVQADGLVRALLDDWKETAFERDGAMWVTLDGEDKVLVKSSGELAYRTTDIAYHREKFRRGFERLVTLIGPDHHDHVPKMRAALKLLGFDGFVGLIVQHCRLFRGAEEVKMSTRGGTYVTLREVMEEVGVDAARYCFAMRGPSTKLDFDLELAKRQTKDNPVFYSQYAAVRVAGILRKAPVEEGERAPLGDPEVELARRLRLFERTVLKAVERLDPSVLHQFLTDVAGAWQRYYEQVKVLCDDPAERRMRLAVSRAVRQVVANALRLLGVSTPERM